MKRFILKTQLTFFPCTLCSKKYTKYISVLLFLLVTSCSHNEIFLEYRSFKKSEWERKDVAVYHVDINNTTDLFDVSLEIRNNNNYPFRNIWLFVDFQVPGESVRTDTIGFDLADVYGKWYGKGINQYNFTAPYKTGVRFPRRGIYTCSVRHGMHTNPLTGISDIGLKISKKVNQ